MKKTLFRGFKPVFTFTAKQNVKNKGFLITTIIVALIMFLIPFFMLTQMGISDKKDNSKEEEVQETEDTSSDVQDYIHNIYFVNNTDMDDMLLEGAVESYCYSNNVKIQVEIGHNEDEAAILKHADSIFNHSEVIYSFSKNEDAYEIKAYIKDDQEDVKSQSETLGTFLTTGIPAMSYSMAGIDNDMIISMESYNDYSLTKAGEEVESLGTVMVKMLLPMMVGMLLYMLINMSAQNVTKVVIAEKTSKLMETLLTSAMPYGIIAGKILAVTVVAIFQMLLWISSMVLGCVCGNMTAKAIYPEYNNIILDVIEMLRKGAADAFSVPTVIIGLVMLILGFLFYCVYAGLVGTFVQKAEDLGNAQVFLVVPLIISWLAAYMAPTLENEALLSFVRIFPLTSPFSIPADVIVGNTGIVMSLISMLILLVITVVLIIATGYLYKKRVFK